MNPQTVVRILCCCVAAFGTQSLRADLWTFESAPTSSPSVAARGDSLPAFPHQAARLDPGALERVLAAAPPEGERPERAATLLIPTPDGELERFAVFESPVMHPRLARWLASRGWPLRTYRGHSLDRPAVTARFDWGGPNGFHGAVLAPGGSYYVDPRQPGERRHYISYFKRDNRPDDPPRCEGARRPEAPASRTLTETWSVANLTTDAGLRIYRAAVAATGDYTTQLAGGSVATAQANVVTIVNRVNATFERELSVRLELVADNDAIVYADAAADPYTEDDPIAMLDENRDNLDSVIGVDDYDIGHVIYRGFSGVAYLNAPCGRNKARAVSGVWQPVGDSIVVDMIAHEMGHQFGASHTFNSPLGSCASNRSGSSAWEPGSGSTIMSYSGTCGADNLQSHSDDYFHGGSLAQMLGFIAGGGSCATSQSTGNAFAPSVTVSGGHTIPAGTAFELTPDSASDGDGDGLTFTWEQLDLGAQATLADGDVGDNPLARSLPPGPLSNREVTGERHGEALPSTSRALNFRLTARDNNGAGGRIATADLALTVTESAGPFAVLAPNGGESLAAGAQTISWDVAGTASEGVDAASVDILLSTDGGLTYPVTLASATPNDGAHEVTLPETLTSTALIKVGGHGNIFFDVSDQPFAITPPAAETRILSDGFEQ